MSDAVAPENERFEIKSWLIGILAAMATFLAATFAIGEDLNRRNADGAKEKTEQVEACASIKDPLAAFVCVQEVNK